MLDSDALQQLVEQQVKKEVADKIVFESNNPFSVKDISKRYL
jgi:hypothetical protein